MKLYGKRLRLTPKEVDIIEQYRDGIISVESSKPTSSNNLPKILLMDVETAPLESFLWRLRTDTYVHPSMLTKDNWHMLSWSAKWLFDDKVINDVCTPNEAVTEDDERISTSIWKLIDDADIVVSHNGKNFDHKMLNMRWMINGCPPPTPYKVIDTLQASRAAFALPSYSLNFIAQILGIRGKLEHEGVNMWKKCVVGDPEALANMSKYNDQDVLTLEDIYLIFRPWIKNHPNIGLFMESEEPVCSVCGSTDIYKDGKYHTSVSTFDTYRCNECGGLSRQRQNALPKELRKILLSGIPGDR